MSHPFQVIIIGAGLAGSLLANGLILYNVDVTVFERLPQDAAREGYQIRLDGPALQGFRACLTAAQISALLQKFGRANGTKSGAPICYNKHFGELLNLAKFPSYSKSAPINRQILRQSLAEPVFAAQRLVYGKAFQRYEILHPGFINERVRIWFDDGDCRDCDLLIGADGSHSKINRQLGLKNIEAIESHVTAIAKSELCTETYLKMTPKLRNSPIMSSSNGISLYFCTYLPDKYDGSIVIDATEFDDSISSSMFAVQLPSYLCPPDLFQRSLKDKWNFISYAFRDWAQEYQEIIDLVRQSDVYIYTARESTRPAKNWRTTVRSPEHPERGHPRVWLLGDAMHAMLPNRGMGGNQALRDTATMLPLLSRLSLSARSDKTSVTRDIAQACKDYEDEMIPRAFGWVEKSSSNGLLVVDSDTTYGKLVFLVAAPLVKLAYIWYLITTLFRSAEMVDDVPEFRT